MNSGQTSERVYLAVKDRLLSGVYRPGERLEPALLAQTVSSSATPVREALNVMMGEQLLESRPGGGFHLPAIDQPGLSDLYNWNAAVLGFAIKLWPRSAAFRRETLFQTGVEPIRRLFAGLAAMSPNLEHANAIERLSDRLQAVRIAEIDVLGDPEPELDTIAHAAEAADRVTVQRLVAAFHRRRVRQTAATIRVLYRRS